MPSWPPVAVVLTAQTRKSARTPLVMNVFEPLTTQPPSTFRPLVRIEATSEPAPGSVIPSAAIFSPAIAGRRKRSCCSAVPKLKTGGVAMPVWAPSPAPTPPQIPAAASSSAQTASWSQSPPWPPSSLRVLEAEEAELGGAVEELARELAALLPLALLGDDLALDPAADRRAQLLVLRPRTAARSGALARCP